MNIGVTLTSSIQVGQEYIDLTRSVAKRLAGAHHGIVFGGTAYGMMLELAEAYKQAGGEKLIGVMAKDLMEATKAYKAFDQLDESYTFDTINGRKDKLASASDALLILPGGYGTLEELVDFTGSKINKLSDKPIAFYNYGGFYDTLIRFCDELKEKQFSKISLSDVAFISDDLEAILHYFETYEAREIADKFV
jgi:uncharacterized protein (TIGR00730 family)